MLDGDEGDVVDLVDDVIAWHTGDGALVLPGQIGELRVAHVAALNLLDRPGGVGQLIGADTRDRADKHHAGAVTTGFRGGQTYLLQPAPDLRYILDPPPMQLGVLPVGDGRRAT